MGFGISIAVIFHPARPLQLFQLDLLCYRPAYTMWAARLVTVAGKCRRRL